MTFCILSTKNVFIYIIKSLCERQIYLIKSIKFWIYHSERKEFIMTNHEIAMEAYYYSINNDLIGGISKKNAVKCFEQIIAMLDSDERLNLPFITVNGKCFVATKKRLIKCSKNMFGYKFKEWNWSQIRNVFYKKKLTTGALILNTVDGEVKISINRDGAEFAGEILRKLKSEAK